MALKRDPDDGATPVKSGSKSRAFVFGCRNSQLPDAAVCFIAGMRDIWFEFPARVNVYAPVGSTPVKPVDTHRRDTFGDMYVLHNEATDEGIWILAVHYVLSGFASQNLESRNPFRGMHGHDT